MLAHTIRSASRAALVAVFSVYAPADPAGGKPRVNAKAKAEPMKKVLLSRSVLGIICYALAGCMGAESGDPGEVSDEAPVSLDHATEQAVHVSAAKTPAPLQTEEHMLRAQPQSLVYCSGFSGNGSMCQVQCADGTWYSTGGTYPNVSNCTSHGNWWCSATGRGWATGHCWN